MLQLKSAQFGSRPPNFVNGDIRGLLGAVDGVKDQCTTKLLKIQQIFELTDNLITSNPHISMQELQTGQPQLWNLFEDVLGPGL